MTQLDLKFLLKPHESCDIAEFWDIKNHTIPDESGVYILIAKDDIKFMYPCGQSPIFYIGQSQNLMRRLNEHLKWSLQAKEDRQRDLYWPRYEYSAAYGGRYCWFSNKNQKLREMQLFAAFAKEHRSFPIANGAGSWK